MIGLKKRKEKQKYIISKCYTTDKLRSLIKLATSLIERVFFYLFSSFGSRIANMNISIIILLSF